MPDVGQSGDSIREDLRAVEQLLSSALALLDADLRRHVDSWMASDVQGVLDAVQATLRQLDV